MIRPALQWTSRTLGESWYLTQNGRALSRFLNSATGGEGDVTFSAYSYFLLVTHRPGTIPWGRWRVAVVDYVFSDGHCERSYLWHREHRLFEFDQLGD